MPEPGYNPADRRTKADTEDRLRFARNLRYELSVRDVHKLPPGAHHDLVADDAWRAAERRETRPTS